MRLRCSGSKHGGKCALRYGPSPQVLNHCVLVVHDHESPVVPDKEETHVNMEPTRVVHVLWIPFSYPLTHCPRIDRRRYDLTGPYDTSCYPRYLRQLHGGIVMEHVPQ